MSIERDSRLHLQTQHDTDSNVTHPYAEMANEKVIDAVYQPANKSFAPAGAKSDAYTADAADAVDDCLSDSDSDYGDDSGSVVSHAHTINEDGQCSNGATFQNIVKPFIGAGILALPRAFERGGLLASSILMITMAVTANWCIRCLLHCTEVVTAPGWRPFNHNQQRQPPPQLQASDSPRHLIQNQQQQSRLTPARSSNAPNSTLSVLNSSGSANDGLNASEDIAMHPLNGESSLIHSESRINGADTTSIADDDGLPVVSDKPSYREIGRLAFGLKGQWATDVNLLLSQFGFCTAYMCFVGDNLHATGSLLSRTEWIIVFALSLCVMCQIRKVGTLSFTSALGNLVYFVSIAVIFYDGLQQPDCCTPAKDLTWFVPSGLPFVFGTACFSLEGIGLVLPIKAAMKQPSAFGRVMNASIAFVTCCYVVFACVGYVFYGDRVNSVITKNLTPGNISNAVRISLCISIWFTYVIQLFPVVSFTDVQIRRMPYFAGRGASGNQRRTIQEAMDAETGITGPTSDVQLRTKKRSSNKRKRAMLIVAQSLARCVAVMLTCILAVALPNFGVVVDLVGSLSNSTIAFILPAAFYVKLVVIPAYWSQRTYPYVHEFRLSHIKPFILPVIVMCMGAFASIIGVTVAIGEIINPSAD